jgi:hypothetical protein
VVSANEVRKYSPRATVPRDDSTILFAHVVAALLDEERSDSKDSPDNKKMKDGVA